MTDIIDILHLQKKLNWSTSCHSALHASMKKIDTIEYLLLKEKISAPELAQTFANYFMLPFYDLQTHCKKQVIRDIEPNWYVQQGLLAVRDEKNHTFILLADPRNLKHVDKLCYLLQITCTDIRFVDYIKLKAFFSECMQVDQDKAKRYLSPPKFFTNYFIKEAINRRASDIHFEPLGDTMHIRFRVDGLLHRVDQLPSFLAQGVLSHIKISADCDISEQRLPQDGQFHFSYLKQNEYDCRISTCPTIHGEKMVVRLLPNQTQLLDINQLGFLPPQLSELERSIKKPHGMILITGPTGSGKTFTLYSLLNHLNQEQKNIVSIEDPVEMKLNGISQVSIHPAINFGFAKALRCTLRQDPDIIMLGEIRDSETAKMAVRAAETGHLVLATLHTNNAAATRLRLQHLGIDQNDLLASLNLVIAQRLIRTYCPRCSKHNKTPNQSKTKTNYCGHCFEGYQGRTGIFELLLPHESEPELTLEKAGMEKVNLGITSTNEVKRVLSYYDDSKKNPTPLH